MLIFEDLDFSTLPKSELGKLSRLYGYCSSHKSLSVAITAQNWKEIPVPCRRISNVFIIWRIPDISSIKTLASKCGLSTNDILEIFNTHIKNKHDSLWLDNTPDSPAPLRINGYKVLKKNNE